MEIVFCERCGVSIPEHQVAGTRQATGGRDVCATCSGPGRTTGDLDLYFCENCRVSIPVPDVLTGEARPDGSGYMCRVCSHAGNEERVARRVAVERELLETGDLVLPSTAAAPAPSIAPVPAPPPGAADAGAPLYFCDACNASIPAGHVATGRALADRGRTLCAGCRALHPGRRRGSGAGVVPALVASLVGAAAALGGMVAWQRHEASQRPVPPSPTVALEARLNRLQEEWGDERARAETRALEAHARTETALGALRAELGGLREAAAASGAEGRRLAALLGTERAGEPDRLARLESPMDGLQDELREQVRVLGESLESRLVKALEAMGEDLRASGPRNPDATQSGGGDAGGAPQPPLPPVDRTVSPAVLQNLELLRSEDAGVRFSAAIELGKLGDLAAVDGLVAALAGDDDVFVRRACARSLGELKAHRAFPALVEAMTSGEEYVAKQAAQVIKEMSGDDFGFKQSQSKGDRKRVGDRAMKWWEENRDRLLAAGAGPVPPSGEGSSQNR